MDRNKWNKLILMKYKIRQVCALCQHGKFTIGDWGTCAKHLYEHEKHTDSLRELSISKYGTCDGFEINENARLGVYEGLMDE